MENGGDFVIFENLNDKYAHECANDVIFTFSSFSGSRKSSS